MEGDETYLREILAGSAFTGELKRQCITVFSIASEYVIESNGY